MASIVTEFVGPRPGCYIMKFCQGATEMVARFVVAGLSVAVLVVAAVSLALVLALDLSTQDAAQIMSNTDLNEPTLLLNSYSAGGIGIGVAVLIAVWEVVMIVLRFLNIGLLNVKSKIFLIIDVVVGLVLAIVVMISGILGAYMANEWTRTELTNVSSALNSLIALAAFALLDGLLLTLLVTWMIVFVLRKWNDEVIKETAKDII